VATLAEIIGIGVDHNGAPYDAVGAEQRDLRIGDVDLRGTVAARLNVAQISQVTILVGGSSVLLAIGVEVRSGRHAAVGVVPKLMNVESVKALGQTAHLSGDRHGSLAALWEG